MDGPDPDDVSTQRHRETLAIVSHDIRAPLGVILGAVAELGSPALGALSADQRALLGLVRRSCEKLSRLANNVALLRRIEGSSLVPSPQRADLRGVVRRVIEGFEKSGELGRIAVETKLPEEAVEANVEPDLAAQAFANVIANAVRFARRAVSVALTADGERVAFVVEDDGPGIAPSAKMSLFDRDARIRASGGKSASGLGLVVAHAIVDAHGGAIRGEDRVAEGVAAPRGARFELSFPRSGPRPGSSAGPSPA